MRVNQQLINKVLVAREELGQKGMVLTHDKKGRLIKFRLLFFQDRLLTRRYL